MLTPQFVLPLAGELVVDLFAGGGGASTGIEQAIGRHVDIAINHDPEAVALHQVNHPQTRHFVSDVFEVDPLAVTDGLPVALLWASPDCKHFSKAKGGKPVSKKIRSLAWVVVKWARMVRPRVICLENVEEFQTWGPLGPDNRPCPQRKGKTFGRWVSQLRNLGYEVEWRELRACDYGAPTIRKRLFLVARCDGQPIVWPEATYGAPDSLPVRQKKQKPWRTAAECIDWTVPAPSIFERERPLADATCRRIAKGIMRYVVDAAEPFIVTPAYTERRESQHVLKATAARPDATDRDHPASTSPSVGSMGAGQAADAAPAGGFAPTLVQTGYGEREGQSPRALDLGKPLGTVVAGQKHALVQAFLAKHYTGVVGSDLNDPMATVTSVDHHSLVAANLVHMGHGEGKDGTKRFSHGVRDVAQPLNTVTANGMPAGVVSIRMEPTNGSDRGPQSSNFGRTDGGQTGRNNLEAGKARQPAESDSNHSEENGAQEQERLSDGEDGVDGQDLSAVSAPSRLRSAGGAAPGWDGHQPSGRRQDQQQTEQPGAGDARSESPACASDRAAGRIVGRLQGVDHSKEVRAFLTAYYGTDQDPQLREPLHTVTTKDRFGLVTVKGEPYAIVDIGLRMLTPRELYRAQGFPDSYVIDRGADGRPLTKTAQVRMCGNSVCPPLARALVAANFVEVQAMRSAA